MLHFHSTVLSSVIVFDITDLAIRSHALGNTQAFKRVSVCGKVRSESKGKLKNQGRRLKTWVDLYHICASTLARLSMDRLKHEVNGDLRSNKENTVNPIQATF